MRHTILGIIALAGVACAGTPRTTQDDALEKSAETDQGKRAEGGDASAPPRFDAAFATWASTSENLEDVVRDLATILHERGTCAIEVQVEGAAAIVCGEDEDEQTRYLAQLDADATWSVLALPREYARARESCGHEVGGVRRWERSPGDVVYVWELASREWSESEEFVELCEEDDYDSGHDDGHDDDAHGGSHDAAEGGGHDDGHDHAHDHGDDSCTSESTGETSTLTVTRSVYVILDVTDDRVPAIVGDEGVIRTPPASPQAPAPERGRGVSRALSLDGEIALEERTHETRSGKTTHAESTTRRSASFEPTHVRDVLCGE